MGTAADWADMMPDTISAQPGSMDGFGEWTPAGSPVALACYISGKVRQIRDTAGNEVVSSIKATCNTIAALTTKGYRYTLPSRFVPNADLEAQSVKPVSDEYGPHHTALFFP